MIKGGTFRWGRAFSWALHDLANTIYSAVVVTIYFPLYAVEDGVRLTGCIAILRTPEKS